MKTESTTMILVTWYGENKQVLPKNMETLDYLISQSDGYEVIEEIEVVSFTSPAEAAMKEWALLRAEEVGS